MDQNFPELINPVDNHTITINNTMFSMGRSLSCNYIVESLEASRLHCVIKKNGEKWTLHDRSSNGTNVNGILYHFNDSVDLKSGDTIKISNQKFIFNNPNEIVELDETSKPLNPENEEKLSESSNKNENFETKTILEKPSNEPPDPPNSIDIMENEFTCSICSELFIKAVTLNCSHTFCKYCINTWKEKKKICPICRTTITNCFPTRVLDSYIDKILESRSDEFKTFRSKMTKEREEKEPVAGPSNAPSTTGRIIEISEDEDFEEEDDEENLYEYHHDLGEFDEWMEEEEEDDDLDDDVYNGIPGHYYGGYGNCYICGDSGHWANGCPRKVV